MEAKKVIIYRFSMRIDTRAWRLLIGYRKFTTSNLKYELNVWLDI